VVARISQGNIDRFYVPEVVAVVSSGNIDRFYVPESGCSGLVGKHRQVLCARKWVQGSRAVT
jgi:hypothetical protein